MPEDRFVRLVGHAASGQLRQRLGPGEGRAFLLREDAGLLPRRDEVELLLRHPDPARDVEVDLQAEGAVVDLRDAQFHQLDDLLVDAGLVGLPAHVDQRLLGGGCDPGEGIVGEAGRGHHGLLISEC